MIRPLSTLAIIVMLASVLLYAACSNTDSEAPVPEPTAEPALRLSLSPISRALASEVGRILA